MHSTPCTVCGSFEFTPNEIDQSLCCSQCGTVLQEWGVHATNGPENTLNEQKALNRSRQLVLRWMQVASFFKLPEELVNEGVKLIDQHFTRPSNVSSYYNEICVGLASSVAKNEKPFWSCHDFMKAFPTKLVSAVVMRSFKMFEGVNLEPASWVEFPEKIIRARLEPIYDEITSQLYGEKKVPGGFNLSALALTTKKLLELGTYQGINGGRKPRPLIAAAALHCALWLHSFTNKNKSASSTVFKPTKKRKKIETISHVWRYSKFAENMLCAVKTIRETYYEYAKMLIASAKKLPWIQPDTLNPRNVHLYLDDILELYSLKEVGNEPVLSLSLDEFAPRPYRTARKKEMVVQDLIKLAKSYNEEERAENGPSNMEDEEKTALFYDVYHALKAGYTEEEIASWSIGEIHNKGELIRLRNATSSSFSSTRESNVDLNRKDIGEDDMHEEELMGYVKSTG